MNDARQLDRIASLYYADVSRYPLPSKEEEIRLFAAYNRAQVLEDKANTDGRESDAAKFKKEKEQISQHIACGYVRFVMSVASKKTRDPELRKDLISEGNIGLMKGIQKFDPTRKVRFLTYAAWWIHVQMQEHLKKGSVHVPNQAHKEMRKKKKEEEALLARGMITHLTVEEPSTAPIDANQHAAEDDSAAGAMANERNMLEFLVDAQLSLRERLVLIYYFGLRGDTGKTFNEISQLFFELDGSCVTSDRVRQMKERSLATLRNHLEQREITSLGDLL